MNLFSEPYKEYINCGNEWIDHLPSCWDEKRVKDLFRLVTDTAPPNNNFELLGDESQFLVFKQYDSHKQRNQKSFTWHV